MKSHKIVKKLSANDIGVTGTHQSGILIPKNIDIISFFPKLDKEKLNPRVHIRFKDEGDKEWEFAFIYYNNYFFGGTRNEYRLTRMTNYLKSKSLSLDDEIILCKQNDTYFVCYNRMLSVKNSNNELQLGTNWRVVKI